MCTIITYKDLGSTMLENTMYAFLEENHAKNIITFDIQEKSCLADILVICTARSSVHARSLGHTVKKYLKKQSKNVRIEGLDQGDWIMVDSPWVMVHIMQQDARDYYDLESLWQKRFAHAPDD